MPWATSIAPSVPPPARDCKADCQHGAACTRSDDPKEANVVRSVSIGTAYSEAAAFVAAEKALLARLVLALMVVPVTVSQLLQPADPLGDAAGMQPWMLFALLSLLIGLVGQMTVSRLAMGVDRSLGGTIAMALRRLPALIGAFVLYFLALGLVLVPLILVMALASGGAASAGQAGGSANALTVLMVFAAVPRILLAPALAMDQPLGPWGLVKATWRASRGQYWRLLSFFLLFLIASLVLALAMAAVVGSLATLALGPPEPLSVSRLVVALAGGLVQGLVATMYAAMIGRIVVQLPRSSINGM
jgi:hypothetical protein